MSVASHRDLYHMGKAVKLVNHIKVENVIFNCGEYNDLEKELIGVLKNIKELNSVIYFNYNNYKFLFMGDASVMREIGHYGSNTSSSAVFINSIKPKYSLISVAKNNRYGHPKESVLDTLINSIIYRIDLDGSIEIKLNKIGYKIRTCPP